MKRAYPLSLRKSLRFISIFYGPLAHLTLPPPPPSPPPHTKELIPSGSSGPLVPADLIVLWYQFTSVQSLSCVQLSATPWTAACQASLSITNSRSLLRLMFIESAMPSKHLILCLQSFQVSGSFPMSQFFILGGQSIGASASQSFQ